MLDGSTLWPSKWSLDMWDRSYLVSPVVIIMLFMTSQADGKISFKVVSAPAPVVVARTQSLGFSEDPLPLYCGG